MGVSDLHEIINVTVAVILSELIWTAVVRGGTALWHHWHHPQK